MGSWLRLEAVPVFPVRMNALYEDGVLKLERPLPLASGTRVQLRLDVLEKATVTAPDETPE